MKIKRIALNLISCFALLVSSIPSTAVFVSAEEVTTVPGVPKYVTINGTDGKGAGKTKHAVFANGTDIEVTFDESSGRNIVTYEGGSIPDVETDADVFAGCHNNDQAVGSDEDPVEIVINGAHLNTVYGGGLHKSTVDNVKITVKGAQVNWVCGGGANCLIKDSVCSDGTDYWQSGNSESSKTLVKNAEINIENGTVANCVYGGGEGFSKTDNTAINIKDGTILAVSSSGSNGTTGNSKVNIEGGNITEVRSVTRGTIASSDVAVSGGTITNLYIGGSKGDTVNGTVTKSTVNVTGGEVAKLYPGTSDGKGITVSGSEQYSFGLSGDGKITEYDTGIAEKDNSALVNEMTYLESKDFQDAPNTDPILFTNGKSVTVTYDEASGQNIVTCEDGSIKKIPTNAHIFAGSHNSDNEISDKVTITIDGAKLSSVWGGGMHKSHVKNAEIVVKSGSKIGFIQGGGAATNSAIKQCVEGCEGAIKNSDAQNSTCVVDEVAITIEDGATVTDIYGGGEGYSKTGKTTVNIKGGDIEFLGAGGSNGYTGTANVKIEGGNIGLVQSVNRGTMDSAEIDVSGGTIDELFIGGEDADDVKGTITSSTVKVTGGTVESLAPGKSGGNVIDAESEGTFNLEISSEADVDLDAESSFKGIDITCTHKLPLIKVSTKTDATCTANGARDVWQCSNCNQYFTDKDAQTPLDDQNEDSIVNEEDFKTDMIAHTYVEHTLKKCDGSASDFKYYTCSVCGKFFDEKNGSEVEIETLKTKIEEATGHKTNVLKGVKATCSEVGYTDGLQCTVCGETIVKKQLINRDSSNHMKGDASTWPETWSDLTQADIDATGYYNVEDCTKGGWKVRECTQCGAKQYKYIDKTTHTWGEPVVEAADDKEATCTEPGKKTKTCSECHKKEQVEIPAKAHKKPTGETAIEIVPAKDATCTESGNDRYWKCSECQACFSDKDGETVIDETTTHKDALGHEYEEVEEIPPTCTSTGVSAYKQCKRCGIYEEGHERTILPVNPNGHVCTDLLGEAKEATCTETGLYAYFQCSACKKYYKITATSDEGNTYEEITLQGGSANPEDLTIPVVDHKYSDTPTEYNAPDCTTKGKYGSVECTVCHHKFKTTDAEGNPLAEDEYIDVGSDESQLDIAALGHAWVKQKETCTRDAYYNCSRCGKNAKILQESSGADETIEDNGTVYLKYIESLDDLNKSEASHNWVDKKEAKDATCTEDGSYAYAQCDKCEAFAEKLPDGTYKEWTVADDKNNDGVITEADFVKKATGHNFEDGFVKGYASPDPCTQPGLKSYAVCTNDGCGVYALATLKAEASEGSDNPEDYDYTPWTVQDNDKNADGKIDVDDFVIDVVGHIYGELHPAYTPEGAAACTEDGKKAYYECSVCNKLFIDEGSDKKEVTENELIIPAPGHKEEDIPASEDVAATCTGEGLTGGTRCSVCKTILTPRKVIPALGHDFKEESYKTKTPATCETNEIQEAKCSRCDVTQTREKPESALGHEYQKVEAKEATCAEPGNIEHYKCSRCSKLFIDEEGVKKEVTADKVVTTKDHEYGELIAEVPATCAKEGTKAHYQCSVCEKLFVDETTVQDDGTSVTTKKEVTAAELVIEKTAHTPKAVEAVAATCTKPGLTEGSVCDVCGEVLVAQTVTPMIDHTPVTDASSDATCTKSGLTEGKHCDVCGGTLVAQAVIPALGHNFVNGVCTRCNEKEPNYVGGNTSSVDKGNSKPSGNASNSSAINNMPSKVIRVTQAKVTKFKVKSKAKRKINVSWGKVKGAKGYEIEVSKNKNFKKKAKVVLKRTKKLKLTIKNSKIKSKKTYYVRIRAYATYKNANGTQTAYSNWNYVLRKVKVK